jgi:hypothetical protein
MPKSATARVEELAMKTDTPVSGEAMAKRKRVAALIRARMAKPATQSEEKLWHELKAEMKKERLTFRS